MAEHMKQTPLMFLQSEVSNLTTQVGSRKLVTKFILDGFMPSRVNNV